MEMLRQRADGSKRVFTRVESARRHERRREIHGALELFFDADEQRNQTDGVEDRAFADQARVRRESARSWRGGRYRFRNERNQFDLTM